MRDLPCPLPGASAFLSRDLRRRGEGRFTGQTSHTILRPCPGWFGWSTSFLPWQGSVLPTWNMYSLSEGSTGPRAQKARSLLKHCPRPRRSSQAFSLCGHVPPVPRSCRQRPTTIPDLYCTCPCSSFFGSLSPIPVADAWWWALIALVSDSVNLLTVALRPRLPGHQCRQSLVHSVDPFLTQHSLQGWPTPAQTW